LHAQGEREGERAQLRVQMSRGKWASRVWALKGRGRVEVAGMRADMGRVHGGGVGERLGMRT
jgi:hypothetical protein